MFSCEFCKISKNTFFTKHLRMTAFIDDSDELYDLDTELVDALDATKNVLLRCKE